MFTDIEGSTELLHQVGDEHYEELLAAHQRIMREAFARHDGAEVDTQGDSFFVAFPRAWDAVHAAVEAQRALFAHAWAPEETIRVRMGIHTGEPRLVNEQDYVGLDVHRGARVGAAGHGGQVLISERTCAMMAGAWPEGVTLKDLGEHRLKGLAHPEHLYQLVIEGLPAEFPPLKTLEVPTNNLPQGLTTFIGREQETAAVTELLARAPLVTLLGPGGTGKTRLSLQVAGGLVGEFPNGVWFIELAPIADPDLVPQAVATVLGVRDLPGRSMTDALIEYLRAKKTLLILDNCEHLAASAARLAHDLLRAAPALKILASSREALGVTGERIYRVPPLSRPHPRARLSADDLLQFESVKLFADRAATAAPGFTVTEENAPAVRRIVDQLDGIPLAIELAAARVKSLAPGQIAARLADRFKLLTGGSRTGLTHHQTLRATIDWSHELLSETERALWRRLAVFAGGFTLEAAEEVCSDDAIAVVDILDLLSLLVDKSILLTVPQEGDVRYGMLESIRQYGLERLTQAGEAERFRERHTRWYLQLAEATEPLLKSPEQIAALDRLEQEHENLRAALEWCRTAGAASDLWLRLAAALHRFWLLRGYLSEGRAWLDGALAAAAAEETPARAWALYAVVTLAFAQGEYAHAWIRAEEALAAFRQVGDRTGVALTLNVMGNVSRNRGDYEQAERLLTESAEIGRRLSARWPLGESLNLLGLVARRRGDYAGALALFTESLALWRESGDKWGLASSLGHLGVVARYQGDYPRSRVLHEESLVLRRELGDKFDMTSSMISLGTVALEQEDYDRAEGLFTEALDLGREIGYKVIVGAALGNLGIVAYHRGDHARARALIEESKAIWAALDDRRSVAGALNILGSIAHSEGDAARAAALHRDGLTLHLALRNAIGVAESLEGLGYVAIALGQGETAARLLGLADGLRTAAGTPLPPSDRAVHERELAALRGQVGDAVLDAAWREGAAMGMERAVEAASLVKIPNPDEGAPQRP